MSDQKKRPEFARADTALAYVEWARAYADEGGQFNHVDALRFLKLLEDLLPQQLTPDATRGQWVMVYGDSGMSGQRWFATLAKFDREYRPLAPWLDVQNDPLQDRGWTPLLWSRVALPVYDPERLMTLTKLREGKSS